MNTWRKDGGRWLVDCDGPHAPGDVVTVSKRNGETKSVTLGEKVNLLGFVFTVGAEARPAAAAVGGLSGILALFGKAKQHLKYPAIVLSVPGLRPYLTIRLSVAGPKARIPGSLTVVEGERGDDDQRAWLGRVTLDGTYQPSREANGRTEPIVARLRAFAAEPAKVAKEHAYLTGRCCFCNTALKDERSTAVGYGATCASHYGLPWGK